MADDERLTRGQRKELRAKVGEEIFAAVLEVQEKASDMEVCDGGMVYTHEGSLALSAAHDRLLALIANLADSARRWRWARQNVDEIFGIILWERTPEGKDAAVDEEIAKGEG